MNDCALPEVCPDHVHDRPATTIAAGLPLASAALAKPPLNIPGDDGRPYKTELVVERTPERTVKLNWWHGPDDVGDRARPHNHPWDFTSTVLHGAITHTRYLSGRGGDHPRILDSTETIRAGESYTVRAFEYHLVTAIEPGTVTRMECGPIGGTEPPGESWGYLDMVTGEHIQATPDPEFRARLAAANPWMAPATGPYRAIAQAIGSAAANDGADPSLTVAAIEAAIAADVAAGHPPPALADVERFFGEDGPEAWGMTAAHPAVAAALDRVMT